MILAAWERESICQKGQSCQEVVHKFFGASGARVRKNSLALVRKRVAPVQKRFAPVRETFSRLLPQRLRRIFVPLPGNFAPFGRSTPSPRPPGSQGQFMNFSQGHSGTKVRYVDRACFPKEKLGESLRATEQGQQD